MPGSARKVSGELVYWQVWEWVALSVRNVLTEPACLQIVYAAHDGCISFIYCLRTQSLGI